VDLILVSERESSAWEDCVWATGVMLANVLVGENRYPATRAEVEGLRWSATGVREAEGDGSNFGELEDGLRIRYNLAPVRRGSGWSRLLEEWPVGSYAGIQGRYGALPSRLRVTGFLGGHAFVAKRISLTEALVYDPLTAPGGSPRRATLEELRRYYEDLSGGEWIAAYEREAWRIPMIAFGLERWSVPAGAPVFENPGGLQVTKFSKAVTVTSIGVPLDRSPDGVNYAWRAVLVVSAALDGTLRMKIGFVRRTDLTAVATPAAWDAAVLKALLDPTFTGGEVIHAEAAEIEAARKAGVAQGVGMVDAEVERLKLAVRT